MVIFWANLSIDSYQSGFWGVLFICLSFLPVTATFILQIIQFHC